MARSLLDAPFDVLHESAEVLLVRLEALAPVREGLLAMRFAQDGRLLPVPRRASHPAQLWLVHLPTHARRPLCPGLR